MVKIGTYLQGKGSILTLRSSFRQNGFLFRLHAEMWWFKFEGVAQ